MLYDRGLEGYCGHIEAEEARAVFMQKSRLSWVSQDRSILDRPPWANAWRPERAQQGQRCWGRSRERGSCREEPLAEHKGFINLEKERVLKVVRRQKRLPKLHDKICHTYCSTSQFKIRSLFLKSNCSGQKVYQGAYFPLFYTGKFMSLHIGLQPLSNILNHICIIIYLYISNLYVYLHL